MKSLIKNIALFSSIITLRNLLKIRPVPISIRTLETSSISDAFAWRTDNNFTTKFKYSDILNIFYKIKDSWVEIHFFSKENKLIKKKRYYNLDLSNEIEINSDYLDGIENYGVFYIHHYSKENIEEDVLISNRCYIGYSHNNNLFSFVHGNTLAKSTKISYDGKIKSNFVKTSLFKNNHYRIQKYFGGFDKNELFFSNPTTKIIKFSIDNNHYMLNAGCSKLIDISDKKIITIISNCLFLRPTVFSYKNNYLDVHHS